MSFQAEWLLGVHLEGFEKDNVVGGYTLKVSESAQCSLKFFLMEGS